MKPRINHNAFVSCGFRKLYCGLNIEALEPVFLLEHRNWSVVFALHYHLHLLVDAFPFIEQCVAILGIYLLCMHCWPLVVVDAAIQKPNAISNNIENKSGRTKRVSIIQPL
jgi:hypothetical protein